MFPYLTVFGQKIPMFSLCAILGVIAFIILTLIKLRKLDPTYNEFDYILPKLAIAAGVGFFGAAFFDALFKIRENGGFKLSGIMFYGGALTGMLTLIIILKLCRKNTRLSISQWLDLLTVPFVIFHIIGRIGCFFGGCCYGRATDSLFGVYFPDLPDAGIYHNGQKLLPTQLFEAVGLACLAIVLHFIKSNKFLIYLVAYAVLRFCIEFLRDDDRGTTIIGLSPSQLIAIAVFIVAVAYLLAKKIKLKRKPSA